MTAAGKGATDPPPESPFDLRWEGPRTPEEQRQVEQYVRDKIERGEAAWPVGGQLPHGATHEIIAEPEGEVPVIRRRRFETH